MSGIRLSPNEAAKLRAMAKSVPIVGKQKKVVAKLLVEVYDDMSHRVGIPADRDTQFALLGRALVGILTAQFGQIANQAPDEPLEDTPKEEVADEPEVAG